MKDISPQTWEAMAEFSNSVTEMIDNTGLTPTEIITVLEMILGRLKQLLEAKKAG
jgi:uncharacterized alpha-E superfamily protein